MILSLSIVNSYLKKPLSLEDLLEVLNKTEIEVEEVIAPKELDPLIVVGEIIAIEKHPNADRLQLAEVKVGRSGKLSIVCGAPNIAVGQRVPVAQVGTVLHDGTNITSSVIRGVPSEGMLCSARELGIGEDHSGIYLLDHSTPVGKTLCDIVKNDPKLDIKTPANRWDFLSVVGICRTIAAQAPGDNRLELPDIPENTYEKIEEEKVKKSGECKRFVLVKMRVKNDVKTPTWLVENLEAMGMRSINPVVDVTNFVMLELGQPSHAYDAKKVSGELYVTHASPNSAVTTIDGVQRSLTAKDLVICDNNGVVGLAGVMGSEHTEVDEQTSEIVLEVAQFDKYAVRKTAQRHGLRTEASARFEKGLPLPLQILAANRIISLLKQIAEAEVLDSPTDQLYAWPWVQHIGFRVRKAEKLIGASIDEAKISKGLKKLGFEVEHFSISKEAQRYLGTPYKFGASFKQDGTSAFDCSYLTEYIYSKIGVWIGHTSQQQYEAGTPVESNDLRPGDLLFYSGHWERLKPSERGDIGHVGMYVGKNKVLMSAQYRYNFRSKQYEKLAKPEVMIVPSSDFLNDPSYKGARRYVESFNHILAVTVPWWRTDVTIEEDLVEETIKLIGYDNLDPEPVNLPLSRVATAQSLTTIMDLTKNLVARGMFNIMTYSFVSRQMIETYGGKPAEHVEVANPLSEQQQYLRRSMFSSHLEMLNKNFTYDSAFGCFEIARVFLMSEKEPTTGVDQPWRLAATFYGADSLLEAKGLLDWLFGARELHYKSEQHSYFMDGRSADVYLAGKKIGQYGQINPLLLHKQARGELASYVEIDLTPLLGDKAAPDSPEAPRYQYITRDITVAIPLEAQWQDIADKLAREDKIYRYTLVDEYRKDGATTKNLTIRLRLDMGPRPESSAIDRYVEGISSQLAKIH